MAPSSVLYTHDCVKRLSSPLTTLHNTRIDLIAVFPIATSQEITKLEEFHDESA